MDRLVKHTATVLLRAMQIRITKRMEEKMENDTQCAFMCCYPHRLFIF